MVSRIKVEKRPIVYVDMDDVLANYTLAHRSALQACPHTKFPQSVAGFFRDLRPVVGAVEAVNRLRANSNLFVLTAPSTRNPLSYTEKRIWIEEHFDYELTEQLILSPDKGLLKGDFLIDDHANGKGQERFEGKLIHFGSDIFPTWLSVLQHFEKIGILHDCGKHSF